MHNIEPLIYILLAILYTGIGTLFIHWLCENWRWLNNQVEKHISVIALALFFWALIFVALVAMRVWEGLNKPRTKDWQDDCEIQPEKPWPRE
jgi:H+/Cl- antiporter ClcA